MALSITPIELNGMVGRTQDFSSMKSAEDAKGMVNQMNFQTVIDKQTDNKSNAVNHRDNAAESDSDAGSGSRNAYSGDGGKNRKKKDTPGRVVMKSVGGFDVSV